MKVSDVPHQNVISFFLERFQDEVASIILKEREFMIMSNNGDKRLDKDKMFAKNWLQTSNEKLLGKEKTNGYPSTSAAQRIAQ